MRHFIVRHAHAGTRGSTRGDDLLRPLSRRGERQAAEIAKLLADRKIAKIRSSRATRCVDTVAPLSDMLGVKVKTSKHLLEGADPERTLDWLLRREEPIVGCSHGDVIGGLVMLLADRGIPLDGRATWPKASTWDIKVKGGRVIKARLLAPPDA